MGPASAGPGKQPYFIRCLLRFHSCSCSSRRRRRHSPRYTDWRADSRARQSNSWWAFRRPQTGPRCRSGPRSRYGYNSGSSQNAPFCGIPGRAAAPSSLYMMLFYIVRLFSDPVEREYTGPGPAITGPGRSFFHGQKRFTTPLPALPAPAASPDVPGLVSACRGCFPAYTPAFRSWYRSTGAGCRSHRRY